jgi:N-acetylglutamate synthase-like GNAT family acetyltransferase
MMKTIYDIPILSAGAEFRKAQEKDISAISMLTQRKNLLFRSSAEIRSLLPYYHVAVDIWTGEIAGCVGAKIYGADAEIISFRVKERFLKIGIGRNLLKKQLEFLSNQSEILRIFALTTREIAANNFLKAGFIEVGIQLFGPKVLLDCAKCPKNVFSNERHLCNEIAVIYKQSRF